MQHLTEKVLKYVCPLVCLPLLNRYVKKVLRLNILEEKHVVFFCISFAFSYLDLGRATVFARK